MRTVLLSAAALTLASVSAAKPFDPRVVPPNALWVAHVDIEAALASTLGRFAIQNGGDHLAGELAEVKIALGVDVLKDIMGMTAFGMSDDGDDGVAVFTTTAAADNALAMAIARGEHESEVIDGVTIHRFDDDAGVVVLPGANASERYVVMGEDGMMIVAAIRQIREPGQGIDLTKSSITRGPGENSMVFFHASKIAEGLDIEPLSVVMQRMEGVRVDVGERQGKLVAEVDVLSHNEEDAQNIAQMASGLLAMARFAGGQDPQAAPFMDMLNGLTQTTDGRTVSLRLAIDPARLIELADEIGMLDFEHDEEHGDDENGEANGKTKHSVSIGRSMKTKSKSPKAKQPY